MYNGKAAMYLMGNFITPNFPAELDGKMDFFQFPVIDPSIPMSEDAPMDTLHIPSKAKNKLGWVPEHDLASLVNDMMESDISLMKKDLVLLKSGCEILKQAE